MLYHKPASTAEAYEFYSGNSAYIAGGTDLGVLLSELMISPDCLIDLCGIPELSGITADGKRVRIGACTKISEVAASPQLPACLSAGASAIGSPQIRNMATIGGNVCNASPCGDTLTPLLVLGAVFEIYGSDGIRSVEAGDFFTGPKKTVLKPGEILTGILIPADAADGRVSGFRMTGKRNGQAISQVNMAVTAGISGGKISGIRIAAGSVAPVPLRLAECEAMLEGRTRTDTVEPGFLEELKRTAENETIPISDVRAGEEYRRIVSGSLLSVLVTDLFSGEL